jgi:hypothetical protein
MGLEEIRRMKEDAAKPKPQKVYSIPKKSAKKIAKEKKEAEQRGDGDTELVKWFKARMKVMGNTCNWCGCKVENKIYQYAIYSICHILDKRETKCPSVKTHPLNFVVLCPDHHTMFDGMNWEEREQLGFWETVRDRLILVYPDLAENERRHFPDSVLEYMKKHDAFSSL